MTELKQLEAAISLIENQQQDQPNLARNCALREIYKAARAYAEAMKQKPFAYLYPYGMGEKELFSYQKLDLSGEKPLYAAPPEALKQEPYGYIPIHSQRSIENGNYYPIAIYKKPTKGALAIYTAPQPATVKLPNNRGGRTGFNDGWNACLAETKRLNGVT